MNRYVAVFLVFMSLALSVQTALAAAPEVGEGYARPTFAELVQTLILLNGFDINDPKVADEYMRLVYCDLYRRNFGNDVMWDKIKNQVLVRTLKKREYFRVRYEVVGIFKLGRYDFKTEFFPISDKTAITNVGSVSLYTPGEQSLDCGGNNLSSMFPQNVVLELNEPLTVKGFHVAQKNVEKMMVRIQEAGNPNRQVYGRIRVFVTDAKGPDVSKANYNQVVLNGRVVSVDFFIDPQLTKPLGGIQISKEQ
jgi:hypothetical protein